MGNAKKLPLQGVNVIDFGQYIAGPAVAMILADLGATVIHIDPPAGPLWDSPANATLNRNKLCLRLDLKSIDGLRQVRELIAQADIVIENFRPGVMIDLGLNFTEIRRTRPELITLSIPGFANNVGIPCALGHPVHEHLDSDSTLTWTLIPRPLGH